MKRATKEERERDTPAKHVLGFAAVEFALNPCRQRRIEEGGLDANAIWVGGAGRESVQVVGESGHSPDCLIRFGWDFPKGVDQILKYSCIIYILPC